MKTTEARQAVIDAIDLRVKKLKRTKAYKETLKEVLKFESDGSKDYRFLEDGMLYSVFEFSLPESLCTDENGNDDEELAKAVLASMSDVLHFQRTEGTRSITKWTADQCHGEAVIYNPNATRREYAIYSNELKLKIERVESEEEAKKIIEEAMEKAGYFPDVVKVDSQGGYLCHFDTNK